MLFLCLFYVRLCFFLLRCRLTVAAHSGVVSFFPPLYKKKQNLSQVAQENPKHNLQLLDTLKLSLSHLSKVYQNPTHHKHK